MSTEIVHVIQVSYSLCFNSCSGEKETRNNAGSAEKWKVILTARARACPGSAPL